MIFSPKGDRENSIGLAKVRSVSQLSQIINGNEKITGKTNLDLTAHVANTRQEKQETHNTTEKIIAHLYNEGTSYEKTSKDVSKSFQNKGSRCLTLKLVCFKRIQNDINSANNI